ncbi:MAG: hypothetical protein AVDCRST_MAG48-3050, partial [uncultured Friedmanniella sp.]
GGDQPRRRAPRRGQPAHRVAGAPGQPQGVGGDQAPGPRGRVRAG